MLNIDFRAFNTIKNDISNVKSLETFRVGFFWQTIFLFQISPC